MGRIDKLFDTYQKRLSFVLLVIACFYGLSLVYNFLFGANLTQVTNLKALIALSDHPITRKTFLGSIIVDYIDYPKDILTSFLYDFKMIRFVILLFLLIFLFSKIPDEIKSIKYMTLFGIVIVLGQYLFIGFSLLSAFSATSTKQVFTVLENLGLFIQIISFVQIVYLFICSFYLVYKNIKSSQE